jgi:photosystem II stability/assembly factor-like uncharacterized protein
VAGLAAAAISAQVWRPSQRWEPIPIRDYYAVTWGGAPDDQGTLVGSDGAILWGYQVFLVKNAAASRTAIIGWQAADAGTTRHLYGTHSGYAVGAAGTIRKRASQGNVWDSLSSGVAADLHAVHSPSASVVYAVGADGLVIKSANQGAVWTPQNSGTGQHLRAVYFVTPDTGFIAGDAGVIRRTTNGGVQWTTSPSGTTRNLRGLFFVHRDTGYAVGDSGTVLKTMNRGQTWISMVSGTTRNLHGVHFAKGNVYGSKPPRDTAVGVVAGEGGVILWTGTGMEWAAENSGTHHTLRAAYVFGNGLAPQTIAAGDSGTILVKDEVTGGILPGTGALNGAHIWMSGSREIRLRLKDASEVSLVLGDVRGRLLHRLEDGSLEAGEHAFLLPETFTTGLFLLDLRVGDGRRVYRLYVP